MPFRAHIGSSSAVTLDSPMSQTRKRYLTYRTKTCGHRDRQK
jgi:hypothetical protein